MNSCKKIIVAFLLILGLQTSTQEVHAFPWKTVILSTAAIAASFLVVQHYSDITITDEQAPAIKSILKCIYEKLSSFECSGYMPSRCLKELCEHYGQFAQECVINLVQSARKCFGTCVANGGNAIATGATTPNTANIIQNCTAQCTAGYLP